MSQSMIVGNEIVFTQFEDDNIAGISLTKKNSLIVLKNEKDHQDFDLPVSFFATSENFTKKRDFVGWLDYAEQFGWVDFIL